ncbi:MAG: hypothetical protein COV52_01980 [Gammaproteobacteria bacterium CG11_big_fil_rev_8_21_14_0_20_46_22]|nr:MAG: hypothetical protein COW05_05875 [Gammaproteobacteria bacterium CG12_big_fil_rev_8_21_14_0_65_46_12]PIR11884.1 MAG: hypothetical protein COV52_01980 [Gammaproteobacteria bacterium CG11_big_fil_rev_8_21_14_0_20_46_22]
MSVKSKNVKRASYSFNPEYGFSGNLATEPEFNTTNDGQEYALLVVYCARMQKSDGNKKFKRREKRSSDDKKLDLIANVKVYDEELLEAVEDLEKGMLINFMPDSLVFTFHVDEETGEVRHKAHVTANDIEVRHVPKAKNADEDSEADADEYEDAEEEVRKPRRKSNDRKSASRAKRSRVSRKK